MNANSPVTINKWLQAAQSELKSAGVKSYPLDSLLILEHVTGFNRAHILSHQDKVLAKEQLSKLDNLLERRLEREPMAYITNVKEFYGRNFYVDKNVLVPRPESESFIELLKKHKITHQNVVDVGCGSGILGITAKLELPTNKVTLLDIDKKALAVAKKNATNLNTDCLVQESDLLLTHKDYTVVMANLPYVPKSMQLEPELAHEPAVALFADTDGLELYIRLWKQLKTHTSCTYVLTESLADQHSTMTTLARDAGYGLTETDGLVQMFKRN